MKCLDAFIGLNRQPQSVSFLLAMATKYKKSEGYIRSVYEKFFGFHQPYQFLIDDTMCTASLQHKFDLKERLSNLVNGNVRLMVSGCVMDALRAKAKQSPDDPIRTGAPFVARRLELRRCHHSPSLSVQECFMELLGDKNQFRYGIASNCEEVKRACRSKKGIPLVYLERTFPLLEPPTKATMEAVAMIEQSKLHVSAVEKAMIKKTLGEEEVPKDEGPKHKRKKVKGPNPLSVKKASKTGTSKGPASVAKPKRKRKAKKPTPHQTLN